MLALTRSSNSSRVTFSLGKRLLCEYFVRCVISKIVMERNSAIGRSQSQKWKDIHCAAISSVLQWSSFQDLSRTSVSYCLRTKKQCDAHSRLDLVPQETCRRPIFPRQRRPSRFRRILDGMLDRIIWMMYCTICYQVIDSEIYQSMI